jgi:bifunctional non-homologous end joining protein LigD
MARSSASTGAPQTVTVEGHRLQLTNLDKVLYPSTGTTKAEVLHYLAQIAPVLIPHAANRPATRKRWPDGVQGQVFFQKNAESSTPSWVRTRRIQHKSSVNDYVLVNDLATVTWLGQTATLEIHVPQWQFGRTGVRHNPDRLVLDLDPGPGAGLSECAQVARWARTILAGMGLDPMPVTSGSKGIHLYAALDGKQDSEQVSAVAKELARYLESEHPELVVSDMKKSLRGGKVLVDWSQNNANKTTIAPYSLRGRDHPTVAAPRAWDELEDPDLRHLEYPEVLERVERDGDLLADLTQGHLAALEPTPERMATFERLELYRSKRDPGKTPEPFGPDAPHGEDGRGTDEATFVIQEHHARRLHWDFRLEHDGVLVSWALPKGEPTDPAKNHLAVQTEDHPLEYGSFEGTIPAGEYGGGEVTIWDAGTYELEKWVDGKEVIVTLHSERRGSRRLALIQTGGRDGDENSWLIHRTKDQPGDVPPDERPAAEQDRAARRPASGRRTQPELPSRPMLATSATPRELRGLDPDAWAFEMKWDGFRTLATVAVPTDGPADGAPEVRLTSRAGLDMTATYPELQALAGMVDPDDLPAVLDGEIVALDARGRPQFRRLQQRANLQRKGDIEAARRKVKVDLMLFDVVALAGEPVTDRTYDERHDLLEQVVRPKRPVHVPPAFEGDLDAAIETSRELRLEGILAKRRNSAYAAGRRSRHWLKLKHSRMQEVVVVGWRPMHAGGARADDRTMGALLLALPEPAADGGGTDDGGGLRYVGKVGTGFREKERREIASRLRSIERATPPLDGVPRIEARYTRWVTPRLVGEVEYADWTADPTDPDLVAEARLRAAVWRGWRDDRDPADIVVE